MFNMIALIIFPALMAYAACSDLLTMKISNMISIALVVSFIALALFTSMPLNEIGWHFLIGAIVLAVSFTFFALGWIGGGDAKLVAATSLWFGSSLIFPYLAYAALLGGGLTLIILIARRWALPPQLITVTWVERLHNRSNGVPYGIALAGAGLLVFPQSAIFLSLTT